MKDKNIKVILVEDDPFWQKNISMYIEKEADDIEVIKIVDSKEKVLEIVENESQIDIVLMDINLTAANLDGIEIIEILSKQKIKAIALTSINEQDVIVESFESGAVNYINKSSIYDIILAIREAVEGRNQIHSDAAGALLVKMREEKKLRSLTSSEREVYNLEKKGYKKRDIAEHLYKTIDTIKKHSRSWRRKLNA
ncbi:MULTISPECIES: response regulator transcription factor [Priestia]|jgi:DNA-binding NarL/FixJ family response regulator|uniref:LuxR family transcriptional regulator n=2 Tax=Priestia megaterium TaxID=1404 RepID=A0A6M6E6Y6_PRIMG|nr:MULTISPECIES: response regulator transcription factor [Priestia]AYE53479.1 response regulator transcription factor [Priestia megaterium NCT-2]MCM2978685.1 response regulator transcription factor [Priestia aryabhattai]MCM3186458.1 response regulator transcription factor [Priestia megaterium]MCM3796504.1 response regulator transcription factor [Priestia megaterium]MDC7783246.1 response regulator transcription factor [Priestia megaterium]